MSTTTAASGRASVAPKSSSRSDAGDQDSRYAQNYEQKERDHFQKVVDAFRYYRIHSLRRITLAERYFHEIPRPHQRLVPCFNNTLLKLRHAVDQNHFVIKQIVMCIDNIFENKMYPLETSTVNELPDELPRELDMDKVKSVLRQLVRDWSESGAVEREQCYMPVIREIMNLYPTDQCVPSSIRVLVPGAGLGRLAHDLARIGYTCQGNEWSVHMLYASHFVLNRCKQVNQYTVYPWIHNYSNNKTRDAQLKGYTFPDRSPADLPKSSNFSMAAGDFLDVYSDSESWNCVATVFFIDTAHNIIEYVETIYKILQPGGYWVNLGPLMYHYAGMASESSVELSYDELRDVIVKLGFEIVKEKTSHLASYLDNPKSMLRQQYDCVFFVARKPTS